MRGVFTLLVFGAVITLGFMLYAGEPERPGWWLLFAPFAAWALLPFGCFAAVVRKGLKARGARLVAVVAALLLAGLAFAALYATFVVEPDPQGGLVFLFLPIWQMIGLTPFWFLLRFLEGRAAPNG